LAPVYPFTDPLRGKAEKSLSLLFSVRKSKSAAFDFLHFQPLIVIENAGPSLVRSGSALNQRIPNETTGARYPDREKSDTLSPGRLFSNHPVSVF
jgi:hypothetical protein